MKPTGSPHCVLVMVMVMGNSCVSNWTGFVVSYCQRFAVRDLQVLKLHSNYHNEEDDTLAIIMDIFESLHVRVQIISTLSSSNGQLFNSRFNPKALSIVWTPTVNELLSFKAEVERSQPFGEGNHWLIVLPQNYWNSLTEEAMVKSEAFIDSNVTVAMIQDNGDISIRQVYRIDRSTPMRHELIGSWCQNMSCSFDIIPLPTLWQRRKNLGGHLLRILVDKIEVNVNAISNNSSNVSLVIGHGYHEDIFHSVRDILNFRYKLGTSELEIVYGELANDGRTWIGMITGLLNGSYDIIVGPFSISTARQKVVDYSTPLAIDSIRVYLPWVETSGSNSKWWKAAVSPFQWDLWICLVATIPLISLILHLTSRLTTVDRKRSITLKENLWTLWSAFCQKDSEVQPAGVSGRLILWSGTYLFLIANLCYGALFTSFLAVRELTLPFQNLREILSREDWSLCTQPWVTTTLFTNKESNEFYSRIHAKGVECQFGEFDEGIRLILEGKSAMMGGQLLVNQVIMKHDLGWSCLVSSVPEEYYTDNHAMGFRKGSPYLKLFNYHLLKMDNTGVLGALKHRYHKLREDSCGGIREPVKAFSSEKVLAPCFILGAGMAVSVTMFIIENILKQKCRRKDEMAHMNVLFTRSQHIGRIFDP